MAKKIKKFFRNPERFVLDMLRNREARRQQRTFEPATGPIEVIGNALSPYLKFSPGIAPLPEFVKDSADQRRAQLEAQAELARKIKDGTYAFEEHACPLCTSLSFQRIASVERFGLQMPTVICLRCGLVQANPTLSQEAYFDFYENHYRELYEGKSAIPTEKQFRDRAGGRAASFFKWVNKQAFFAGIDKKDDLILEIGCSVGMNVSQFHDRGYRVLGVDLDEDFMALGKSLGYDLRHGTLRTVELPQPPRMIYYRQVLEHIVDIGNELRLIAETLPPNGYLVVAVPGLRHIEKAYDGNLRKYLQIAHVYHFSLHTLCALASRYGLSLVTGDETIRAVFQKRAKTEQVPTGIVEFNSMMWHLTFTEKKRMQLQAAEDSSAGSTDVATSG